MQDSPQAEQTTDLLGGGSQPTNLGIKDVVLLRFVGMIHMIFDGISFFFQRGEHLVYFYGMIWSMVQKSCYCKPVGIVKTDNAQFFKP